MSTPPEPPHVRLDNHTLRIGDDAYPLHTITGVATVEHRPDRHHAVRHYAIAATSWLFPATIAAAMTPEAVSALITLTALAWFTLRTTGLVRFLTTTRYELVVDTTSARHHALTSDDLTTVAALAFRITDALRQPPKSINQN